MSSGIPITSFTLDLTKAVVFMALPTHPLTQKAAQVLIEEVEKRTRVRWSIQNGDGIKHALQIKLGVNLAANLPADGFQISTSSETSAVSLQIMGNDARGLLFGVGYLLRHMQMRKGSVILPQPINLTASPHYALRGHQLGYRDKTNAYDGWDLPQWDQYMRELAIFGTNAIELIPPRSDDKLDSVHFPLPPLEMMAGMSAIADDYGLDVWIWYPALDDDYARPEMVEFALTEWEEVYRALPRSDKILVPGGDPGNTRPKFL